MRRWIQRGCAAAGDYVMCSGMDKLQRRHPLTAESRRLFEEYIARYESLSLEEYYAVKEQPSFAGERTLTWTSPIKTAYPENNRAHVDLYPCAQGWSAPTVFMLHALISRSDAGYRLWAARFNALGWNACFLHLPYHYSRTPAGCMTGELAVTADLIRTGEGLRQGVMELRQLMRHLRSLGCREFGLWATSYGGWIGALLSFLESDFRFLALISPIVNVEHAIWTSPASKRMRRYLHAAGIDHALVSRHFRLISPIDHIPLCGGAKVILAIGDFDSIALPSDMEEAQARWKGAELIRLPQGHYSHQLMPAMLERLKQRGDFNP